MAVFTKSKRFVVQTIQMSSKIIIFLSHPIDKYGILRYNAVSVIYGSRMNNTRFVVSFLLFYTKLL